MIQVGAVLGASSWNIQRTRWCFSCPQPLSNLEGGGLEAQDSPTHRFLHETGGSQ